MTRATHRDSAVHRQQKGHKETLKVIFVFESRHCRVVSPIITSLLTYQTSDLRSIGSLQARELPIAELYDHSDV